MPLSSAGQSEWVLTLIGDIPQYAEAVFPILGRVVGVQLEAIRARRREWVRARVEALLGREREFSRRDCAGRRPARGDERGLECRAGDQP